MHDTTDSSIRAALHGKKFRKDHASSETIVIDELGVAHGKCRVDIAVLNGCIHGYEIKSARDTLNRLPKQLDEFSRCLERVTLVLAPNHMRIAVGLVPDWCGILLAEQGPRGGIAFQTLRRARKNPNLQLAEMARLLWRTEAIDSLRAHGMVDINPKATRAELYQLLADRLSLRELTASIKSSFRKRDGWRADPQPSLDGD